MCCFFFSYGVAGKTTVGWVMDCQRKQQKLVISYNVIYKLHVITYVAGTR